MLDEKLVIEITTGHCLGGVGNDVYPGDVLEAPRDLSIEEARKKVRLGYARVIEFSPPPLAEKRSEPAVAVPDPSIEARDPEIESPRPKGRPRAGGR